MQPCIRRRLLLALVTLVGVSWLMFGILWLIPGDVAIAILGEGATAERIAVLREQMGLNDPWYGQYGRWATDMARGHWGTSRFIANKSVKDLIVEHDPVTVNLAVYPMTIAVLIGITLGTLSGIWSATWLDYVCRVFSVTGVVELFCNVHREMVAYIVVVPGRAFAVTATDGKFELLGVPPGKHRLVVWDRFTRPRAREMQIMSAAPRPLSTAKR